MARVFRVCHYSCEKWGRLQDSIILMLQVKLYQGTYYRPPEDKMGRNAGGKLKLSPFKSLIHYSATAFTPFTAFTPLPL